MKSKRFVPCARRRVRWLIRSAPAFVVVVFRLCESGIADADEAAETLAAVVRKVEANERLYASCEVVYSMTLNGGLSARLRQSDVVVDSRQECRSIQQGGLLYVKVDGDQRLVSGEKQRNDLLLGYDGAKTRIVSQKAVANIVSGPKRDSAMCAPHTLLLKHDLIDCPLSVFLKGGETLHDHPDAARQRAWRFSSRWEGTADVAGLRCEKVVVESTDMADQPIARHVLWLANDRNYVPVKMESFAYQYSKELCIEEGAVVEWQEVQPRTWFPIDARVRVYCDICLLEERKKEVATTREFRVTKVDLRPDYDISLFRDIAFPDGIATYEVEDGKITSSYTAGSPSAPDYSSRTGRSTLLLAIGCLIAVIGLAYGLRRRRARPD